MKTVIWILLLNTAVAFPDLAAQRIHSLDLDAPRPPVRREHLDLGGESITGERVAVNNPFIEVDGRPCNAAIVTRGSIPLDLRAAVQAELAERASPLLRIDEPEAQPEYRARVTLEP